MQIFSTAKTITLDNGNWTVARQQDKVELLLDQTIGIVVFPLVDKVSEYLVIHSEPSLVENVNALNWLPFVALYNIAEIFPILDN